MKQFIKYTIRLVMFVCVSFFVYACEQDPKFKIYDYPVPVVESISPTSGFVATQVVITGSDFGNRVEAVKVFFGDIQSTKVVDCKNNRLVVEVPENAVSGNVSLQIFNKKVDNIGHYTVLPTPRVTAMSTPSGSGIAAVGEIVTIYGENFGVDANDITVSFNGSPAQFELLDESTILATTPEYQTGEVIVTVHGYKIVAGVMLNPDIKGDVTSFYLKNYQQPFDGEGAASGDWSKARDWNQNEASLNPSGCRQKDKGGDTFLCFQCGWGKQAIADGKIWQATTLRPGEYVLEVSYVSTYFPNSDENALYAVMLPGNSEEAIPDVKDIKSSEGYSVAFDNWSANKNDIKEGTMTLNLTIDKPTEMVFGFLMNVQSKDTYFKVSGIKLTLK